MTLPVKWLPKARRSLLKIAAFIGEEAPDAADRLISTLENTADALPQNPYMYRRGRVAGTREAVVTPNYLIVYCVEDNRIAITNVLHARQKYP